MNIGTGTSTLLTLTTGAQGTASGELPATSRTAQFWVKETKAPAGYDLYKPTKTFTAGPGAPVTVTVTNAKTATTSPPSERPTDKPTEKPSDKPSPDKPGKDEDTPAPSASGTPTSNETASSAPSGSLAHTGADATPWLIGGAGVLIVAGGGALFAARRRRTDNSTDDSSSTS
ncbi:LAETG motif-containing sortase-dependent surface protein [Streptomyces sp. NPDC058451]|uniref:LAETG motif-containing sortase-dependent surface protein n=1 Tax=Streptomyces sp. NPDC058451 TaxID=3346506 RepID=UPI0036677894